VTSRLVIGQHEVISSIFRAMCANGNILLEGVLLHRATGRYATYVMKTGLTAFLELVLSLSFVSPPQSTM